MSPLEIVPSRGTLRGVWSRQLRNRRDVDVYLPASYEAGGSQRYPVVYMQDGQNLTDPALAFAGTWRLYDALQTIAAHGVEPIVVGIHNTPARLKEYSPFPEMKHGGGAGDAYLKYLIGTVKPRINRLFRTRRTPLSTAIVGSSMGGLISLYAWFARPDVFGLAAAMSPSLWFGRDALQAYLKAAPLPRRGRFYLDVGTAEGAVTLRDARLIHALLEAKGLDTPERMQYIEDDGGRHDEAAWGRRIPGALEYLCS